LLLLLLFFITTGKVTAAAETLEEVAIFQRFVAPAGQQITPNAGEGQRHKDDESNASAFGHADKLGRTRRGTFSHIRGPRHPNDAPHKGEDKEKKVERNNGIVHKKLPCPARLSGEVPAIGLVRLDLVRLDLVRLDLVLLLILLVLRVVLSWHAVVAETVEDVKPKHGVDQKGEYRHEQPYGQRFAARRSKV